MFRRWGFIRLETFRVTLRDGSRRCSVCSSLIRVFVFGQTSSRLSRNHWPYSYRSQINQRQSIIFLHTCKPKAKLITSFPPSHFPQRCYEICGVAQYEINCVRHRYDGRVGEVFGFIFKIFSNLKQTHPCIRPLEHR